MKIFKVPVEYKVWGLVDVVAKDLDDLLKNLNNHEFIDKMSLPYEPEYIEDSYKIDFEGICIHNKELITLNSYTVYYYDITNQCAHIETCEATCEKEVIEKAKAYGKAHPELELAGFNITKHIKETSKYEL